MIRDTRELPCKPGSERAVLGGLLLEQSVSRVLEVADVLSADDFHDRDSHQALFRLLVEMASRGEAPSTVALADLIQERGGPLVQQLGYLTSLADDVPSLENQDLHVHALQRVSARRQAIYHALHIMDLAYAGEVEPEELGERAAGLFKGLGSALHGLRDREHGEIVQDVLEQAEQVFLGKGPPPGPSTGFGRLDYLLGPLQPADLVVVAARPSQGKTSLGLNLAISVAEQGQHVGFFTLEMTRAALVRRALARLAPQAVAKLKAGRLDAIDRRALRRAAVDHDWLPILYSEATELDAMRVVARRWKQRHPSLSVVVVDYIGFMQAGRRAGRATREEIVSENIKGLKEIAKEERVTLIALAQLNREIERRRGAVPMMSDIRESGVIEATADTIIMLHRDLRAVRRHGLAVLNVAKQRDGELGSCLSYFSGPRRTFYGLELER